MISVSLAGCSKDPAGNDAAEVSNTLTSGTWRITYFWDSGNDHTTDFSGYNFTFHAGGVLTAALSGNNETGSWAVLDSGDDSDNCDLEIGFTSQNYFGEISGEWHILELTDVKVRMVDESGSGGADYLTFGKN
jgi:hypothetical protein